MSNLRFAKAAIRVASEALLLGRNRRTFGFLGRHRPKARTNTRVGEIGRGHLKLIGGLGVAGPR